jgi:hypothetical protein
MHQRDHEIAALEAELSRQFQVQESAGKSV